MAQNTKNNINTQRYLWHGKEHDDICFECGCPGELLECDECPRVYHLVCLGLDDIPTGKYSCPWHYCKECRRFTFEFSDLAIACCSSCATCYCISCVPDAVAQRLRNPNLAHFANKNEERASVLSLQYILDTDSIQQKKNLIKSDYRTGGGQWCGQYLAQGSQVFLCQNCEASVGQESNDFLKHLYTSHQADHVASSSSSAQLPLLQVNDAREGVDRSEGSTSTTKRAGSASLMPSHRLFEILQQSHVESISKNLFDPSPQMLSGQEPQETSPLAPLKNQMTVNNASVSTAQQLSVSLPTMSLALGTTKEAPAAAPVVSDAPLHTRVPDSSSAATLVFQPVHVAVPAAALTSIPPTASQASLIKQEAALSTQAADTIPVKPTSAFQLSGGIVLKQGLPEQSAAAAAAVVTTNTSLEYGKSDPQIDYQALKLTPVECARVGEAYPIFKWNSVIEATAAIGQEASFIYIASHSFERFKLGLDDKVKLAFGFVWRHCPSILLPQDYPPLKDVSVVCNEVRTFWMSRVAFQCKAKNIENEINAIKSLLSVPDRSTGLTEGAVNSNLLSTSRHEYEMRLQTLENKSKIVPTSPVLKIEATSSSSAAPTAVAPLEAPVPDPIMDQLVQLPVDIYHEDSHQFMHRFKNLKEALTELKLASITHENVTEMANRLGKTMYSIQGQAARYGVIWYPAATDVCINLLIDGKMLADVENEKLHKDAPAMEQWFSMDECYRILHAKMTLVPLRYVNQIVRDASRADQQRNYMRRAHVLRRMLQEKSPELTQYTNAQMVDMLDQRKFKRAQEIVEANEHAEIRDLLNDLTMVTYFADRDGQRPNRLYPYEPRADHTLLLNSTPTTAAERSRLSQKMACLSRVDNRILGVFESTSEAAAVCKCCIAQIYSCCRSGTACAGFLWKYIDVPKNYFTVPFKRSIFSPASFPRLPTLEEVQNSLNQTNQLHLLKTEFNALLRADESMEGEDPEADQHAKSILQKYMDAAAANAAANQSENTLFIKRGKKGKQVDIRLELNGPVLRRFVSGMVASDLLDMKQTQISAACCANAKAVAVKNERLARVCGLIFTFKEDTERSHAQGVNVMVLNIEKDMLAQMTARHRRKPGRPAAYRPSNGLSYDGGTKRPRGRPKSKHRNDSDDGGFSTETSADEYELEVKTNRAEGKRVTRRPQREQDSFYLYTNQRYTQHTKRQMLDIMNDSDSDSEPEPVQPRSSGLSSTEKPKQFTFLISTEHKLPVIGRAHQAIIPELLYDRDESGSDWDSEVENLSNKQMLAKHRVASAIDCDSDLTDAFLSRALLSQYVPGLLVHLAMPLEHMSCGVVIEEPEEHATTVSLSDGLTTRAVPIDFIQRVVNVDTIVKAYYTAKSLEAYKDSESQYVIQEVKSTAINIRSRQWSTALMAQFFDAVERHGSDLPSVHRALQPLTSRSSLISRNIINSEILEGVGVDPRTSPGKRKATDDVPNEDFSKFPRTEDNNNLAFLSTIEPSISALDASIPEPLTPTKSTCNDAVNGPDMRDIIYVFYLYKSILPCRKDEDILSLEGPEESHPSLQSASAIFSSTVSDAVHILQNDPANSVDPSKLDSSVENSIPKDKLKKLRRTQVLAAFTRAEEMNRLL